MDDNQQPFNLSKAKLDKHPRPYTNDLSVLVVYSTKIRSVIVAGLILSKLGSLITVSGLKFATTMTKHCVFLVFSTQQTTWM